jgi:hypothetical protein
MVELCVWRDLGWEPVSEGSGRALRYPTSGRADHVLVTKKCELMPDLHPAPVAEDIDEPGARRSIRLILIIMGAGLLLPLLGFLAFLQFGHRPTGVHHSPSVWDIVIILAVMGIMVVAMLLLMRRQYRRPRYRRVMQYGWRRRSRVAKDLRRGRTLSTVDMPWQRLSWACSEHSGNGL